MRDLLRNQRTIYYALRTGELENTDDMGNLTGESTPIYGEKTMLRCHVSASVGNDTVSEFGSFTNYTRTLTVSNINCPIDEDTVIWFGVTPDNDTPPNYIVTKRADSKNGVLYALLEVEASYGTDGTAVITAVIGNGTYAPHLPVVTDSGDMVIA